MPDATLTALRDPRTSGRDAAERATDPAALSLTAAVLGFFVVTFDAVVVNVALPSIRGDFGGGITALQWVVDGYTLMFAALLLWAGAFADRAGARRAFALGVAIFVVASAACGCRSWSGSRSSLGTTACRS
jgi:DHA2 family methylenomycin A resistance protein-like MFS transporter